MDLRPLRIGEIVDSAFHLYRSMLGTCLKRTAPFVALAWFLICVFSLTADPKVFQNSVAFIGIPTSVPTLCMVAVMYTTAFAVLCACTPDFADALATTSQTLDPQRHAPRGLRRRIALFAFYVGIEAVLIVGLTYLTYLLKGHPVGRITAGIAIMAIVLPVLTLTAVAAPAAQFERISFFRGLRRSMRLVALRYHIAGSVLAVSYLMFAPVMYFWTAPKFIDLTGLPMPGTELAGLVATSLASVLALFMLPYIPAVATSLYLDLRVRIEGLDLALAARTVGVERKTGVQT